MKEIHWAYPTSTMAKRFKRRVEGCWFVSHFRNTKQVHATCDGPFNSWEEAKMFADNLPGGFGRYSMEKPVTA